LGHFVEFRRGGGKGLEEEVVVVRHARVVEDAGVHGIAGELVGEGLDVGVFYHFSCDELVEFRDDEALVFGPGESVAFCGEEARDADLLEGFIVGKGWDVVQFALLLSIALEEGGGLGLRMLD